MTTQTEAERLAGYLDDCNRLDLTIPEAAAELRRQASFINQLMNEVERLNKAVADEREAMVAEAAKRGLAMKNEDPFEDYVRDIANDRARSNT